MVSFGGWKPPLLGLRHPAELQLKWQWRASATQWQTSKQSLPHNGRHKNGDPNGSPHKNVLLSWLS